MPKSPATTLQKIYTAAEKFLVPLTPKETYKTIVNEACSLVGGTDGLIMLAENGTFPVVYASSEQAAQTTARPFGFTYTVFETNQPLVLYAPEFAKVHPEIAAQGVKTVIFVPLSYQEHTVGVLAIRSKIKKELSYQTLEGLKVFGSLASLAIRKTQLYSDTRKAVEARDLFIALAAHELRTPLTSIMVYIELIKKYTMDGKIPDEKWVRHLEHQTHSLVSLVNELLEVNQIERGQLKYLFNTYTLDDIVAQAMHTFSVTHPTIPLQIQNVLLGKQNIIYADKQKLVQVLMNLLQNAAKFSPVGVPISLWVGEKDSFYMVSISDKGEGMDKKELSGVFDQFYKAKTNNKEGLGLGLFLTKAILESHGGGIEIISAKHQGTTVTITVPKHL